MEDNPCSKVLRDKTHSHQYLWLIKAVIPIGREETDPCGGEGMARTAGKSRDLVVIQCRGTEEL